LTAYRLVFIFNDASLTIPTAVHEIEASQYDLYNDEVDGLITYEIEYGSAKILSEPEI
jgi:hypothetical protein